MIVSSSCDVTKGDNTSAMRLPGQWKTPPGLCFISPKLFLYPSKQAVNIGLNVLFFFWSAEFLGELDERVRVSW